MFRGVVEQREADGYINASKLCDAGGKRFHDYRNRVSTKTFLNELSLETGIPVLLPNTRNRVFGLIQSVRGGFDPASRGIWVHPRVAIHLGQWISPRFAVRISGIVFDWMQGLPRHNAMQAFLLPSPDPWEKRFPDEFWIGICRLKRIPWPGMSKNRPQWMAGVVNDLVWDRLEPAGLREELEHRNPRQPSGERGGKHHQNLNDDAALVLWARLMALVAFMVASRDWDDFMGNVKRAFPKPNENRPLPF